MVASCGLQTKILNYNLQSPFVISPTAAHLGLFLSLMALSLSVMGKINFVTIILSLQGQTFLVYWTMYVKYLPSQLILIDYSENINGLILKLVQYN